MSSQQTWEKRCQIKKEAWDFASGDLYVGDWANGFRHGQGTYTGANGSTYTGAWKEGQRHGFGTYSGVDGTWLSGMWENGTFIGS